MCAVDAKFGDSATTDIRCEELVCERYSFVEGQVSADTGGCVEGAVLKAGGIF